MTGENVRAAPAARGRVDLFAEAMGLLIVDIEALLTLNRIDEDITVATRHSHERVAAGDIVATIKIIPFAVQERILGEVADLLPHRSAIAGAPFHRKAAGLVMTHLPHTKDSLLRKREQVRRNGLTGGKSCYRSTRKQSVAQAL